MALADLWDNLKQPYFISSAIDDMKDLAEELKDIVVDFVEEADELFTVGFREMVIKNNKSYQTSATGSGLCYCVIRSTSLIDTVRARFYGLQIYRTFSVRCGLSD